MKGSPNNRAALGIASCYLSKVVGPARVSTVRWVGFRKSSIATVATRAVGQEPQRGGLFIVTWPFRNEPNPSGVTCLLARIPLPGNMLPQVTPLGFGLFSDRGMAINRSPHRGYCEAPNRARKPNRVAGRIALPAPTPPDMRVRIRRFRLD